MQQMNVGFDIEEELRGSSKKFDLSNLQQLADYLSGKTHIEIPDQNSDQTMVQIG